MFVTHIGISKQISKICAWKGMRKVNLRDRSIKLIDTWCNHPVGTSKCLFRSIALKPPHTVDPQRNTLYWEAKWNLHTVCWGAVGCEWGTTSFLFGITYVFFIFSRIPVFNVEPQNQHRDFFLFLSKIWFKGHTQNLKKCHVVLKFEWVL